MIPNKKIDELELIRIAPTKTIDECAKYFGVGRDTIGRWKKKLNLVFAKPARPPTSEETKKAISEKRKEWLKNNPERHPWRNRNKFKSEPCEKAKEFLTKLGLSFISEYQPEIEGRYFSVDIALPDKMIALEVNGNQHYERDGRLKPYYQERHELLEAAGWNVFEIHYSACFNLDKWADFANQILNAPRKKEFDYFNYKPKEKKSRKNFCSCGCEKEIEALRCKECFRGAPRKKRGIPIQTPTGNSPLEEGDDMQFHHRDKKPSHNLCLCGNLKQVKSKQCSSCWDNDNLGSWPSQEEMKKLVWEIPSQKLAKKFGASDVALAKFCKRNGIEKPPRGYWSKIRKSAQ